MHMHFFIDVHKYARVYMCTHTSKEFYYGCSTLVPRRKENSHTRSCGNIRLEYNVHMLSAPICFFSSFFLPRVLLLPNPSGTKGRATCAALSASDAARVGRAVAPIQSEAAASRPIKFRCSESNWITVPQDHHHHHHHHLPVPLSLPSLPLPVLFSSARGALNFSSSLLSPRKSSLEKSHVIPLNG